MNRKDETREQMDGESRKLPDWVVRRLADYRAGRLLSSNELDELAYALLDLEGKRVGKRELNDIVDIFEACLPESVRPRLLRTPRIATRVLEHANALFGLCDQKILDKVLTVWFDRERRRHRGTKRKDPDVTERRRILKKSASKEDLKNPGKLRSLFGQLERERVPIPGDNSKSTEWLQLLDSPTRQSEKIAAISVLNKDFSRM